MTIRMQVQEKRVGGVSLLLFKAAFSCCVKPGRIPDDPSVLFWLAPAGIRRFTVSCPSCAQRVTRTKDRASRRCRLGRIMTGGRPCRFCAIAVTLATRTCVRLRARWVGGLSSAT